jgi:hypothetical protein
VLWNASRPHLLEQQDGLVDILRPNNRPGRQTQDQIPVVIAVSEEKAMEMESSSVKSHHVMQCDAMVLR